MGGVADLRLLVENGAVKYRPDVDGLRAVAVIAVVAFHAFPGLARGGFVGVDVFFVISGYLISGIILGALEQERFSFADFYARRIRRIFPSLAVVLAASYAVGWFVLFADDYKQLSRHIAAGVAFVSNFVLWDESGYFDDAGETKPLQHLWSLGIEEQFYLAWPTLLVLAWRMRVHPLGPAAFLLASSFLLNVKEIRWDLVGTFYSPFTRLWELLIGAVLSAAAVSRPGWPTGLLQTVRGCRGQPALPPRDRRLARHRADRHCGGHPRRRPAVPGPVGAAADGGRVCHHRFRTGHVDQPERALAAVARVDWPDQLSALPVALAVAFVCPNRSG